MSLIWLKTKDSEYYLVDPYWCAENWYIKATDEELVIGIKIKRRDVSDKTLMVKMRRVLRNLGVKGRVFGEVLRSASVFRMEGGDSYESREAGICDLEIIGPITAEFDGYLDHFNMIIGLSDLENQTIWNGKRCTNVGKKNRSKNS